MKSDPAKEYAACLFLQWFTEAERNLHFTSSLGYMPVRQSSFDEIIAGNLPEIPNPITEKSLLATTQMQQSYSFYFPPVFDGFENLQAQYAERLRQAAQDSRDDYLRLLGAQDPETAFDSVSKDAMENYIIKVSP